MRKNGLNRDLHLSFWQPVILRNIKRFQTRRQNRYRSEQFESYFCAEITKIATRHIIGDIIYSDTINT